MPIKIDKKNKSKRVEIVRVGKFERRYQGDLEITSLDLQKMKQNFDADARRQQLNKKPVLPFNFGHNSWDEAAGWITELEIGLDSNNFEALFAAVDWTDKGARKIKDNEFKFVSSEFSHNYKDPETGKIYDIILGGAALTNIPFIRDMEAVHLLDENENGKRTFISFELSGDTPDNNFQQGENMPDEKLIKAFQSMSPEQKTEFLAECGVKPEDAKLSETLEQTKIDLVKAQGDLKLSEKAFADFKEESAKGESDIEKRLKLSEKKSKDMESKVGELIKERAADQKTIKFNQMLSEGKACEAQRAPYLKGNMDDFAAKAEPVKLDESGHSNSGDSTDGAKVQDTVLKLAEEKRESNKDMTLSEAIDAVFVEKPDLATKYNQED